GARAGGVRGGVRGSPGAGVARLRDDDLLMGPDHNPLMAPHPGAEGAAQGRAPARGPRKDPALMRPPQQIDPPREERDHGAPAEPPEGARDELLDRARANGGFGLGEEGNLHEVEVVEDADPRDARQEVNPPQQDQPTGFAHQRHEYSLPGETAVPVA